MGDVVECGGAIAKGELRGQARSEVVAVDEGQGHGASGTVGDGLHAVDVFGLFRLIALAVEERFLVGREGDPFVRHVAGHDFLLECLRIDGDEVGHVSVVLGEVEQALAPWHPSQGVLVVVGRDGDASAGLDGVEFLGVSGGLTVVVGVGHQDVVPLGRYLGVIDTFAFDGVVQFDGSLTTLPGGELHVLFRRVRFKGDLDHRFRLRTGRSQQFDYHAIRLRVGR